MLPSLVSRFFLLHPLPLCADEEGGDVEVEREG
jgi:hypothetical protein